MYTFFVHDIHEDIKFNDSISKIWFIRCDFSR